MSDASREMLLIFSVIGVIYFLVLLRYKLDTMEQETTVKCNKCNKRNKVLNPQSPHYNPDKEYHCTNCNTLIVSGYTQYPNRKVY